MSSTHKVDNHTLTLLRNGEEYFPRLMSAIDNATRSVYMEAYIYAADAVGRMIQNALQRAAKRGVVVRLLLDGYGSADLPQKWVDEMRAANIDVLWFRKEIGNFSFRRYHLRRLHRKLVLVDECIAFVGGINITNDVPGGVITQPRLDYAIELQGPATGKIFYSMQRLWMLVSWTNFRLHRIHAKPLVRHSQVAQQKVVLLIRDNLRHRHDIEQAYLKAIADAQHEIIIANAYFLPGVRLRRALLDAVKRGVRVILLLQGRVEYRLQHFATLALYGQLLGAGIEIYEYHVSFLHAKVAVVDSYWSTVGSSNIDPFSLWLAREANLAVSNEGFAEALRTNLMHEIIHNARPVSHTLWRKHGILLRLKMHISYTVVRFLIGVSGYARDRDEV